MIYSEKIFSIPFKEYSTASLFPNQSNPITNKYMSQIAIEMEIGIPAQKLNCSLNLMNYHSLFLSHKIENIELPTLFIKDLSSTYAITKEKKEYINEDFDQAESFSERIQIYSSDNRKILDNNFNFILIDNLVEDEKNEFYAPGQIGLQLDSHNNKYPEKERFISQIKNKGYTRNTIFSFEFNENGKEGNFIIGKDVYYNNNFFKFSIKNTDWVLNFDKVLFGNTEVENPTQAIIETETGLIVGTIDYEDIIKEFFKKQNNCEMKKTKMGYEMYLYFVCDKDFNESKMDNLTFYFNIKRKELNFTFTGKDLFFLEDGKKYFKIIFHTFPNYFWHFGREFLKKYQLFFDIERKIIYAKYNDDFSFISYFNDVDFWTYLILIIALLSIILYVISYPKRNKRKKRKNELEDEKNVKQDDVELLA